MSPRQQNPPQKQKQSQARGAGTRSRTQITRATARQVPWWRSANGLTILGSAVIVVGIVAVLLLSTLSGSPPAPKGKGVNVATVVHEVTDPNPAVLSQVGTGGQPGNLTRTPAAPIDRSAAGLPVVTYVGAEFCPFCGAERWVILMALSRFGQFTGVQEMSSSSTDEDPNTSTFTFLNASYSSPYVSFQSAEIEDRNQNPLQSPSASVSTIFTTYDQAPYTSGTEGFPFIDIGGRFYLYQTSYDPAILQGLSWQQIAGDLSHASNPITQAIVGNANLLTAAICETTAGKPAAVCSAAYIKTAETEVNSQPNVGKS